jgi:hypothetical protein
MTNLLYILAWTMIASTIPPALDIVHGLTANQRLPDVFLEAAGRRYARYLAWMLVGCAIALLAWGQVHLSWSMIFIDVFACVPAAIVLAKAVQATWRLYGGGLVTAGVTIYLWSAAV